MKDRIDFLVAGNQKCGTNALHELLSQHPSVRMSAEKELHFFDRPPFDATEEAYAGYHRSGWGVGGEGLDDCLLYAESTPKYVLHNRVGAPVFLRRIAEYNPNIKLIVLFRDPVSRAFSQWNMLRHNELSPPPFDVLVDEAMSSSESPYDDVLRRGQYGRIAFNILSNFPEENCCFVRAADLNEHVRVFEEFLGVEAHHYQDRYSYVLPFETEITPDVAARLREYYRPEMLIVQKLIGIDVEDWIE